MAQPPIPQWFGAQPPPGASPPPSSGAGARLFSTLIVVAVAGGAVWYTRTLHKGAPATDVPSASEQAKLMAEREQLTRQVAELEKSVAQLRAKADAGLPLDQGDPLAVDPKPTARPGDPLNPAHGAAAADPLANDPVHATPAPTPAPAGGALDGASVQKAVAAVRPSVKQCFDDELKRDPASQGRVQVAISIAPDGHVASTHAASSGHLSQAMIGCVQSKVSRARFPAASETTTVAVPFVFSGGGG